LGDAEVTEGYMTGPALAAPSTLLAATTYNSTLTLAMAFYEPALARDQVTTFLDLVKKELPS
jgi:NRPS condensation-like uncharacterized protein